MTAQDKLFGYRPEGVKAETVVQDIRAAADECAKRFKDVFDINLDFSEASLQNLDKLISEMGEAPANMNLVVTDLGSYLGEMLVRNLHGRWVIYERLFNSAVAFGEETTFYPFHKVYKRLTAGPEESLWYFYRSAQQTETSPESK